MKTIVLTMSAHLILMGCASSPAMRPNAPAVRPVVAQAVNACLDHRKHGKDDRNALMARLSTITSGQARNGIARATRKALKEIMFADVDRLNEPARQALDSYHTCLMRSLGVERQPGPMDENSQ